MEDPLRSLPGGLEYRPLEGPLCVLEDILSIMAYILTLFFYSEGYPLRDLLDSDSWNTFFERETSLEDLLVMWKFLF